MAGKSSSCKAWWPRHYKAASYAYNLPLTMSRCVIYHDSRSLQATSARFNRSSGHNRQRKCCAMTQRRAVAILTSLRMAAGLLLRDILHSTRLTGMSTACSRSLGILRMLCGTTSSRMHTMLLISAPSMMDSPCSSRCLLIASVN